MRIVNGKPYFDAEELSNRIGRGPMTLRRWRQGGTGPAFIQLGKTPLYAVEDVEAWIAGIRRGGQPVAA
jgi:hypothetical protein